MATRIWHLASCSTCKRILATLPDTVERQDVRTQPLSPEQLDRMVELAGGVAPLFSKRARKYRELGLHERQPSDAELRALLLEHDTFLKRPVAIVSDGDPLDPKHAARIYIGSSKGVVTALDKALNP